jgi:TPR repeat protein
VERKAHSQAEQRRKVLEAYAYQPAPEGTRPTPTREGTYPTPEGTHPTPPITVNVALRIDKTGAVIAALILSDGTELKAYEDNVIQLVWAMQPFSPPPKGRESIDVIVPVLSNRTPERVPSIPDTSPNVSRLLTLVESAGKGDVESQYVLGKTFLLGDGIRRIPTEALSWLQKAAEQEHADAEYLLGRMYAEGSIVAQDRRETALIWFRKAAGHGNKEAEAALRQIQRH